MIVAGVYWPSIYDIMIFFLRITVDFFASLIENIVILRYYTYKNSK